MSRKAWPTQTVLATDTRHPCFSVTFAAVAISAAQDIFEITAPSNRSLYLCEVRFGQYTDFGDAAAEILSVQIIRGYTTSGSGGSAFTPLDLEGIRTAGAAAEINNTTVAQDGTAQVLVADAVNIAAGWLYTPPPGQRIRVLPSGRLVVRITAPADSLTCNGTLIFEEVPDA